jgi:hypothetical protein
MRRVPGVRVPDGTFVLCNMTGLSTDLRYDLCIVVQVVRTPFRVILGTDTE